MADDIPAESHDTFRGLRGAIISDLKRHVRKLREAGIEFYGYAVLPPDYYTELNPVSITAAYNRESDIAHDQRDSAYYRYSVDEWANYDNDGFDTVKSELNALLPHARSSETGSTDDRFVDSIYREFLIAMESLRREEDFKSVPYLVLWISDSDPGLMRRSARLLNDDGVYSEFASEFC